MQESETKKNEVFGHFVKVFMDNESSTEWMRLNFSVLINYAMMNNANVWNSEFKVFQTFALNIIA